MSPNKFSFLLKYLCLSNFFKTGLPTFGNYCFLFDFRFTTLIFTNLKSKIHKVNCFFTDCRHVIFPRGTSLLWIVMILIIDV